MKTIIEGGEPPICAVIPSPNADTGDTLAAHASRGLPVKIKTILVPLDFSRASMQALSYAVSLAKHFQSVVHLVHVHHPDEASSVPGAGHLMRECAESVEFLKERLSDVQRKHAPSFWPENCHVRTGVPYREICDLAHEVNADLIVLATRGHSGLKRVLLGSTAERVVRFAPCPVFITRQRKPRGRLPLGLLATNAELNIRKILVPVDFSSCSLAGAIYAALLAKTFDATLCFIHVLYPSGPLMADRVSGEIRDRSETDRANARLNMEAFTRLDFLHDIKYESEIRTGHPIDEICSETSRPDIDLVITSTHGRTGLKHMLLGSVAEHVVRYSNCPVMVVPSQLTVASME
jgi:nucleotide-binding universal stress UspA family protein